ncbi:hypothetical protein F5880DRAFT_1619783 [Lentinula raphanica]|nr:hypothetical protein F5880DRAFT_1619783 [Lentinula raphanica]
MFDAIFEAGFVFHCGFPVTGAQSTLIIPPTHASLLTYRPLEGIQIREFSISSSLETMRTGPVPWLGFLVDFVKGEYKGQCGAVRDVNRYQVIPSLRSKRSGLVLTVERYVFTANPSSKFVKVDYDAVRFHSKSSSGAKYRLCDVFMPTSRQSFYMPDNEYQREHFLHDHTFQPSIVESSPTDHDGDSVPSTPLCNDLEQETIFCADWDLSGSTPAPDMPTAQTPLFESRSPPFSRSSAL